MKFTPRFKFAAAFLAVAASLALAIGAQLGVTAAAAFYIVADLAMLPLLGGRIGLYANSLGTLSTALILTEALSQAVKLRPALSRVTTDWSAQPAKLGDVVRSRIIGAATVNDFGTAAADRTDTDASVTLSAFKEVRFKFTAAEISATNRNFVAESAAPMAEAIADYFMDVLSALWASTTYTNTTTVATAAFAYTTLTSINEQLSADSRAVPKTGRFGIVNSAVYRSLLEDPLCNRTQKCGGEDPIATGRLAGIAGFEEIFEHPGLPTTNNTNGWFGQKSSTALVVRPPRDPRDLMPNVPVNANMGVISIPDANDPTSPGLSVMAVEVIDPSLLTAEVIISFLAGAAVTRAGFGQRTKTA